MFRIRKRRAVVAGFAVALVGAAMIPPLSHAFASTDGGGGDVLYEADCTTSLKAGVAAPYLIGLNLNASPDSSPATGATFGATGSIDFPVLGPVIAGLEGLNFLGASFAPKADFIIGSTDGTATGSIEEKPTFPAKTVGHPGDVGRQITKVQWAAGGTTLTAPAGSFAQSDDGYSVAFTSLSEPNKLDPLTTITNVSVDGTTATISVPALLASDAGPNFSAVGVGTNTSFSLGGLTIPDTTFTTNGVAGGNANIGVTSVKSVTVGITFGANPGVGANNCLLTGWGEPGDVAGPAQTGASPAQPVLPAPPAAGSANALVAATGGFISQPGTTQKITPPPAAHVTLVAGTGSTSSSSSSSSTSSSTATSSSTTTSIPTGPTISIGDVQVTRPDKGSAKAVFTVTISEAPTSKASVKFETADGSAIAPTDYKHKKGSVSFSPTRLSRTISVSVIGGTIGEPNKDFFVNLSAPKNASILDGQGEGTIVDNHKPGVSIADASINVPSRGTALKFTLTVTKAEPRGMTCKIAFATQDVTAKAGIDYGAKHGSITFRAGATTATVSITVKPTATAGDTFIVQLSNPTNCQVVDGIGAGNIT
jgi:hypothetical protein